MLEFLPDYKQKALEDRRAALLADYEVASTQLSNELSEVNRRRLKEQLKVLEQEINQVEAELEALRRKIERPACLFICYKRDAYPDQQLASYLHETLTALGHEVFIDQTMRTGIAWLDEIDQQIKRSDFLVVLLSKSSADSEMVQAEVSRAYEYRRAQGKPLTLPVRVAYEGLLPYSIHSYLNPLYYIIWENEADNERVTQDVLAAIAGKLPQREPTRISLTGRRAIVDGRVVADDERPQPPLPEFDPRFLEDLRSPGGTVRLYDPFYIKRQADADLQREIVGAGTMTTIRAARQTGKSSLLVRGMHTASQQGAKVVTLDLQRVDEEYLASPDHFLRYLASFIVRKLRLDGAEVKRAWQGSMGPQDKLTCLMEDYVLPEVDARIVLALDEVDRLLETPFHSNFFGLMRAWFNSAAYDPLWEKLNIVLVISTEPHLLIKDLNQSPFNVGLKLYLKDFDQAQVGELNRRHGSPLAKGNLLDLMALLGGHPYLVRKALYALVTQRWSWGQLVEVAVSDQGPFSDHLRRYYWLLRAEPELCVALRDVLRRGRCADDMAFLRLLQAGLVKGSGQVCACRCDLYRQYFEDKV